ncbi:hypothetical protein ACFQY0_13315 [Haloferula chungangensis]|uniref:RING-type E3 ubiquitin transferase n=1 Tax=Haloferula chungangensis TaxID=1048331 RepID=A0ABW2L746_9BACT
MIVILSYLSLLLLLALSAWIVWIRGRGALGFWIRPLTRKESWAVGVELGGDDPVENDSASLAEVVALVRTLDRESGHVVRQWDREKGTRFIGLMLSQAPEESPRDPYELRHFPSTPVLRLSGRSNVDGVTPSTAAKGYLDEHGLEADLARPFRISGQSFSQYEWEILGQKEVAYPVEPVSERMFQMRDIVLYPLILTLYSIALIGTGSGGLFAAGLLILIFLSGACKFVFVHQREDESQESHLQNY